MQKPAMLSLLPILFFLMLLNRPNLGHAIGGSGATCTPATTNWGSCSLTSVPFAASVTKTANIPAGNYPSPFVAGQANTRYVLQGNMTANGIAIIINASNVIIDLNRHIVTYNQSVPGEGITSGSYGLSNVAVINGSVIQGATKSEGASNGVGNNPIGNYNSALAGNRAINSMYIGNIYVEYGGRDINGLEFTWNGNLIIEQTTVKDTYSVGTLKNRQHAIKAINNTRGSNSIIRHNTIVGARHIAIGIEKGTEVHNNHLSYVSLDTNSSGIGGYKATDCKVYSNTIIGRGVHALGISFVSEGTNNIEIYDNLIDLQITKMGQEYGDEMYASGFRTTWGGNNIKFYKNQIDIKTAASFSGTYARNNAPVTIHSRGKGLFIGINENETATFSENIITLSGDGVALGIAPSSNKSDALFIIGNTISTPHRHIVLEDTYAGTHGFPLFANNHLIRTGNNPDYFTISGNQGGYGTQTARFVDNTFAGGASIDSINLHPSGKETVNVYFGTKSGNEYSYNYRLHDNNGASSTLIREDFSPAITLSYANPATSSENIPPTPSSLAAPGNFTRLSK